MICQENLSEYNYLGELGRGSCGEVYKVKVDGKKYAIKSIQYNNDSDFNDLPEYVINEITALRFLRHNNIINIIKVFIVNGHVQILMPYYKYDLYQWIISEEITGNGIKNIMYQLLQATHYMHIMGYIHRDIKPQNILVEYTDKIHIKLIDFNLSKYTGIIHRPMEKMVQTLWYRAPELLLGDDNYDYSIDIWSIGCVLLEIINKKPYFRSENENDQLISYFKVLGTPNTKIDSFPYFKPVSLSTIISINYDISILNDNINILKNMLVLDFNNRLSAIEILQLPYFSNFTKPIELVKNRKKYYKKQNIKSIISNEKLPAKYVLHMCKNIDKNIINILFKWIISIGDEYKLFNNTIINSFYVINEILYIYYTSNIDINKNNAKLLVITCLCIADKITETNNIPAEKYISACRNAYSLEELINMEKNILVKLNFNIPMVNVYLLVKSFTQDEIYEIIILLFAFNLNLFRYKPSQAAAGIIYFGHICLNINWEVKIEKKLGYNIEQIKECVIDIRESIVIFNKCKKYDLHLDKNEVYNLISKNV